MVPFVRHVRNFFYLVGSNLTSSKLTPTFVEEKELEVESPQMRPNFIIPWLYERPAWKVSCSPTSTKWKVLSHFLPSFEWPRQKEQRYFGSLCFILYHFDKCLCFSSGIFADNGSWLEHILISLCAVTSVLLAEISAKEWKPCFQFFEPSIKVKEINSTKLFVSL